MNLHHWSVLYRFCFAFMPFQMTAWVNECTCTTLLLHTECLAKSVKTLIVYYLLISSSSHETIYQSINHKHAILAFSIVSILLVHYVTIIDDHRASILEQTHTHTQAAKVNRKNKTNGAKWTVNYLINHHVLFFSILLIVIYRRQQNTIR